MTKVTFWYIGYLQINLLVLINYNKPLKLFLFSTLFFKLKNIKEEKFFNKLQQTS